jgi:hypothetical protein
MEEFSKPKATLIIKVMEHGTITGAEGGGRLEFDDCVNAVNGLIDWMARSLAEVNETNEERIGAEILTAALYSWTFDRHVDESEESEDLLDEEEEGYDEEDLDENEEDTGEEFPHN